MSEPFVELQDPPRELLQHERVAVVALLYDLAALPTLPVDTVDRHSR